MSRLLGPELETRMDIAATLDEKAEADLLVEITSIARKQARRFVDAETSRDIAQDVALECLIRIREGTHEIDLERLPGLAARMAQARGRDHRRRERRRERPDEDYMRELTDSTHAWMEPDAAVHEEELEQFRERTIAELPEGCRRTYTLVREEGRTYEEAAVELGVSRSTVHAHVVLAQRRFREGLPRHAVPVPPSARGARRSRSRTRSGAGGGDTDAIPAPSSSTRMRARSPPSGQTASQPTLWRRTMQTMQGNMLQSLRNVAGFLDQHADRLPAVNQGGARQDLDAAIAELETHASDQSGSSLGSQGATQRHRTLRLALIRDHMLPIARIAAANLPHTPELQPLRMPAGRPTAQKLAAAAHGMAEVAAKFATVFTHAGLPDDFLAQLATASDAMIASLGERSKNRVVRRGATEGLTTKLRAGRRAVGVLDALVRSALAGDNVLIASWTTAKRIQRVGTSRPSAPTTPAPTPATG